MATQIEIDFAKALSQAKKIEEIAGNIERVAKNKFDGSMQVVAGNWKGPNAEMYLKKGESMKENLLKDAASCRTIAAQIREAAKRIYDAEMANAAIATIREY